MINKEEKKNKEKRVARGKEGEEYAENTKEGSGKRGNNVTKDDRAIHIPCPLYTFIHHIPLRSADQLYISND